MKAKMVWLIGIFGLIVVFFSWVFLGFGNEQTQAAPPAAGTPQVAPQPSPKNVDKIKVGMYGAEIQRLIGPPPQFEQKGAVSEWRYPKLKLIIRVKGNKVVAIEHKK
jgi:hypothetical protein